MTKEKRWPWVAMRQAWGRKATVGTGSLPEESGQTVAKLIENRNRGFENADSLYGISAMLAELNAKRLGGRGELRRLLPFGLEKGRFNPYNCKAEKTLMVVRLDWEIDRDLGGRTIYLEVWWNSGWALRILSGVRYGIVYGVRYASKDVIYRAGRETGMGERMGNWGCWEYGGVDKTLELRDPADFKRGFAGLLTEAFEKSSWSVMDLGNLSAEF